MHVVIGGFGRVGRYLSHMLEDQGHTVSVIDRNAQVFAEYGQELRGHRIAGAVFDRETLLKAGIERADAFAAVTSGDNSNIVSARVARERFGVPNVVARIFDPRRAVIYEKFGIPTISSVQWAGGQLLARLLGTALLPTAAYGNGEVVTVEVTATPALYGKQIAQFELPGQFAVSALARDGVAVLPQPQLEIAQGDRLYVTTARNSFAQLKQALGLEEGL